MPRTAASEPRRYPPFLQGVQVPLHVSGNLQRQQLQGPVPAVVHRRLHLVLLVHRRLGRLLQELDDELDRSRVCWVTHTHTPSHMGVAEPAAGRRTLTRVGLLQMFLQQAAVQQELEPGGLQRRAGPAAGHCRHPVRHHHAHPALEMQREESGRTSASFITLHVQTQNQTLYSLLRLFKVMLEDHFLLGGSSTGLVLIINHRNSQMFVCSYAFIILSESR